MALEVEILAELKCSVVEAKRRLDVFEFIGSKKTIDIYYYHPESDDLKPDLNGKIYKCFRLREKNKICELAYKVDHYDDGIWKYSDETQVSVSNFEECHKLILLLGLKELVVVDNTKHTFLADGYEIVIEEVRGLGNFIEVEAIYDDSNRSPDEIKIQVRNFISKLGIDVGKELNSGKPELLIKKRMQGKNAL